jgi:hypothetical protein
MEDQPRQGISCHIKAHSVSFENTIERVAAAQALPMTAKLNVGFLLMIEA